jgi:predicted HTH domain antitoxin
MKMKPFIDEVDELLVSLGKYPNKKETHEDALRALLRSRPDLIRDIAIELYKEHHISLSRAAELCRIHLEDFKALLKERGISIEVPPIPLKELDEEVDVLMASFEE